MVKVAPSSVAEVLTVRNSGRSIRALANYWLLETGFETGL